MGVLMKERVSLWDNLKFFLIVMVVIGHIIPPLVKTHHSIGSKSIYLFIYSFHMPLFIFVSGLFHRNKNILNKVLFYFGMGFALKIAFAMEYRAFGNVKPFFSFLSDYQVSWFMFALGIFTLIMYLLRNQNKVYLLFAIIILSCFIGYDKSVGNYLYLARVINFLPYYILGTLVTSDEILAFKKKHKLVVLISVVILLLWVYICLFHVEGFSDFQNIFNGNRSYYYGGQICEFPILKKIASYVITCLVSFSLVMLTPNIKIWGITKWGRNTIDVYFWHYIVYLLLVHYAHLMELADFGAVGKIAIIAVGVILSVVLSLGGIWGGPSKIIRKMCFIEQGVKSNN
jgi:fucose 4-O-acetylase-like acetyltransferase